MKPGDIFQSGNRTYLILDAEEGKIIGFEISPSEAKEGKAASPEITGIKRIAGDMEGKIIGHFDIEAREDAVRSLVKNIGRLHFKNRKPLRRLDYIPPSGKVMDDDDLSNLIDASLDMWLSAGRFNRRFEKALSETLDVANVLTVNSGSSANLLAISALTSQKLGSRRLQAGDEVITVAAGFPTTVTPIIQNGLVPVFVDVHVGTYNIDVSALEKAVSEKTGAIISAHTLGNPFNIEKLLDIAKRHNLWIIEDNCDALGTKYRGRYTGSFGDMATFSFYPAHHITMGEGGAVVTGNDTLYSILNSMRDWGRDCWCETGQDNTCGRRFDQKHGKLPEGYDHKYVFSHLGYNLKVTDWQAAIGLSQLKKLPSFIRKRKENFYYLYEGLKRHVDTLILPVPEPGSEPCWFGFPLTVRENALFTRRELIDYLEQKGIGTRLLFAGNILRQPAFTNNRITIRILDSPPLFSDSLEEEDMQKLASTEFIMNATFWIGIYPGLERKDLDYVISAFQDYHR